MEKWRLSLLSMWRTNLKPPLLSKPKDTTRELLELINEFGKVAGYKIHTQKSRAFLHTNNERSEKEIKETTPLNTVSKRIKS